MTVTHAEGIESNAQRRRTDEAPHVPGRIGRELRVCGETWERSHVPKLLTPDCVGQAVPRTRVLCPVQEEKGSTSCLCMTLRLSHRDTFRHRGGDWRPTCYRHGSARNCVPARRRASQQQQQSDCLTSGHAGRCSAPKPCRHEAHRAECVRRGEPIDVICRTPGPLTFRYLPQPCFFAVDATRPYDPRPLLLAWCLTRCTRILRG